MKPSIPQQISPVLIPTKGFMGLLGAETSARLSGRVGRDMERCREGGPSFIGHVIEAHEGGRIAAAHLQRNEPCIDRLKICLQNNTEMYYNVNHHEELP
jgi:hypothetical protein